MIFLFSHKVFISISSTTNARIVAILNNDRIVYTINVSNKVFKNIKNYHRHTLSWKVLEHCRHYKSGKVAWIKPFTKGTGKIKLKTYVCEN